MSIARAGVSRTSERIRTASAGALLLVLLAAIFVLSPWSGGDDWETFRGAAQRIVHADQSLYGTPITHAYYSNPPWLAALLLPVAALPFRWGWALLSAWTLIASLLLLRRWETRPGLLKPLFVLLSPSMIYTLMHGQIDLLILAGIFLPAQWWILVALTKPQAALGLIVLIPRRAWVRAALLTAGVVAGSLVIFGPWPLRLLDQPRPFVEAGHNLWLGLWPMQVPAGVLLIALAYSRRDERLAIAGTPFLSPYAALSSLLAPWIAAVTFLKTWQAALVFASWWSAVILRALEG